MAKELKRSYVMKELYTRSKRWSLIELENTPHLHSQAQAIRQALHANKTLRDIQLQNKKNYENHVAFCKRAPTPLLKSPEINKKKLYFVHHIRYRKYKRHQLKQASLFKLKVSIAAANEAFFFSHFDFSMSINCVATQSVPADTVVKPSVGASVFNFWAEAERKIEPIGFACEEETTDPHLQNSLPGKKHICIN